MEKAGNMPIGVFDSGLGGLTVAREIMRNLPNERIVPAIPRPRSRSMRSVRKPVCR